MRFLNRLPQKIDIAETYDFRKMNHDKFGKNFKVCNNAQEFDG